MSNNEEYFNSSRLKVIGLILASAVVVGALGAIAGIAFDNPAPKPGPVIQPGTGQTTTPDSGGFGDSVSHSLGGTFDRSFHALTHTQVGPVTGVLGRRTTDRLPSSDITITPTPATGGGSAPSSGGTSGDSSTSGTAVDIGNGVDLFEPDGWSVQGSSDSEALLTDGHGNYAFGQTTTADASTSASDLITENLDGLLPPDSYTQRQTTDVQALDPFGSVVSGAEIEYEALWVDNQGSQTIHGQVYVGVRQDGTVLVVQIEHLPADGWDGSFDTLSPIVDNTFNRFGGLA